MVILTSLGEGDFGNTAIIVRERLVILTIGEGKIGNTAILLGGFFSFFSY